LLLLRWRRRSPSTTFTAKLAGSGREAYAAELRERGVHATEIARRLDLLKNHSASLEADRWDRFYGDPKSNYNRAPNAFLEQVVQSMKPGTVLDYAMGDGRNAIYFARLGWTVHGFDMSEVAVKIGKERAARLGLKIDATVSTDADYRFGKDRFDLIVFSWSMTLVDVRRVIAAV
jgi:2-polyprenyl-3-methyl-5-hydroxy-6-metoxy-1,4-benzoquinol methylase